MRRILSMLLALMMIMSLATTAFADEATANDPATENVTGLASDTLVVPFYKEYNGDNNNLYPLEELPFTVTQDSTNGAPVLTVSDKTTEGDKLGDLELSVGAAAVAGKYFYTIVENVPTPNKTQGVIYTAAGEAADGTVTSDDATKILVTVWVYYKTNADGQYVDANDNVVEKATDRVLMKSVTFTSNDNEKINKITNQYDVYDLTVNKTISGALASSTQEFEVDVTFTLEEGKVMAENAVISYTDGTEEKTIGAADINEKGSKTVTVKFVADETITFLNIPNGISYEVVENAKHSKEDTSSAKSNPENGYTVTYTDASGEDTTDGAGQIVDADAAVTINNHKDTNVETGVITESAPYIVLIAVCAAAAVLFIIKRRNAYDF